ncbi:MAG: TfoX/Sxy family protein [Verrucomicrobiales bacterium]|nr:TfoX/Sxy family protein [Verrucomicrobiales bacterium]MCP5557815.1 TfoX/Sxy family protein [Verrucomicrobiaceae bacterium]
MAYDTTLADRVTDFFTEKRSRFDTKRMFGGLCFMVNDKMCVGVMADRLMVRLDPEVAQAAQGEPGVLPMDFTGRPMPGFVFVTAVALDEDAALALWLRRALDFNPKAKASKKK